MLILTLVGSQFVTTVASQFISLETASQIVTIPYRAFLLLISVLLISLTAGQKIKINGVNKWLWVYWGIILFRFAYDMYIRNDIEVAPGRITQLWLIMIFNTLFPMYAIMKSYQYVNPKLLFQGTFALGIITALIIISSVRGFLNVEDLGEERLESNFSMGSIQTGYFGLLVMILSVYGFMNSHGLSGKAICAVMLAIGTILMFRAGSRGPIFAISGMMVVYLLSKRSNPIITFVAIVVFSLFFINLGSVLRLVSSFAPNLYLRFAHNEGVISDRLPLFQLAWDSFKLNPVFGHDFAIYTHGIGGMGYAHNMFLDSLMQSGIIGFILIGYIVVRLFMLVMHNIKSGDVLMWLDLFIIMRILMLQLSSAFYIDSPVSIIMIYLFQRQMDAKPENEK